MIQFILKHIFPQYRNLQVPQILVEEEEVSIEELEKQKKQTEFLTFLENRKFNDQANIEDLEYKKILIDWFIEVKLELKSISTREEISQKGTKALMEEISQEGIEAFWIFIQKIWTDQKHLKKMVRSKEDLVKILMQEKKFHVLVHQHYFNNNDVTIGKLLKKNSLELKEGSLHPTMLAAPFFCTLSIFNMICDLVKNGSGIHNFKDLGYVLEYYFTKINPELMNFDLSTSLEIYHKVFIESFATDIQNLGFADSYQKSIQDINRNIQEKKLLQQAQKEKLKLEDSLRKKEIEMTLIQEKEISKFSKMTRKALNRLEKQSQQEYLILLQNETLLKEPLFRNLVKTEYNQANAALFEKHSQDMLQLIHQNNIHRMQKIHLAFSNFISFVNSLPSKLVNMSSLEEVSRKDIFRNRLSEIIDLKKTETQHKEKLIKTLAQIQRMPEFFLRKEVYQTQKFLLPHIQQAEARVLIEKNEAEDFQEIQREMKISDLLVEERAKRSSVENLGLRFQPVKTHSPYGQFPWKIKSEYSLQTYK